MTGNHKRLEDAFGLSVKSMERQAEQATSHAAQELLEQCLADALRGLGEPDPHAPGVIEQYTLEFGNAVSTDLGTSSLVMLQKDNSNLMAYWTMTLENSRPQWSASPIFGLERRPPLALVMN
jgi:hypothetical protein